MAHVQVDNTIAGCFFVDERKNFCFLEAAAIVFAAYLQSYQHCKM